MFNLRKNNTNEKTLDTINTFAYVARQNMRGIDFSDSEDLYPFQIVLNMFKGIQTMNTLAVMNSPVVKCEAKSYEDFISVLYEGSM